MKKVIEKLGLTQGFKEMVALTKKIPKDGKITTGDALIYNVLFWQMKAKLSDMVTKAERHELNTKRLRENMAGDIQGELEGSEASRVRVSKTDKRWRILQEDRLDAKALTSFLKMKRDDFDQAVYVMRTVLTYGKKDMESMPEQEL